MNKITDVIIPMMHWISWRYESKPNTIGIKLYESAILRNHTHPADIF